MKMLFMIIHEQYLNKIRLFYSQDIIKVITGISRAGKSILLIQIIDEIKSNNIKNEQIIYINFEYDDYDFITNNKELTNHIKSLMTKN